MVFRRYGFVCRCIYEYCWVVDCLASEVIGILAEVVSLVTYFGF